MADARRQLADAELDAELVALASRLDYPPTPDLAPRCDLVSILLAKESLP